MDTGEKTISDPVGASHFHQTPDHCKVAFDNINNMRRNKQMTDVTLKVGDVSIPAHRIVLASASPYFYAMFNCDMAERHSREVVFHQVDVKALQLLVDYCYTGEIVITEDNVQELLPASSQFLIDAVRESCCEFLLKQLHPSNCLGISRFADTYDCKKLYSISHNYALQNFEKVMATEEFLLLTLPEIEELISNDRLNVVSEEKVFLGVVNWVKHCIAIRAQYMAELLSHVRLPLTSSDFLSSTVGTEVLVKENFECNNLLMEAMRYQLCPEQRPFLISERTFHRSPEGLQKYVFAVGGVVSPQLRGETEVYNPRTDRWFTIAPMISKRYRTGAAGVGRLLYVVGGSYDVIHYASGECYNPQTNSWSRTAFMNVGRSCLGVCNLNGLVYACGGCDGTSCLKSTERYDPLIDVWSSCPAMNAKRRYCKVTIVGNCIYAIGGYDSKKYQTSLERLDPREGKWVWMPRMRSRRPSCGVASIDGVLYCTGGYDGNMCIASAECFDTRLHRWEPIAPMNSRRSTHELVNCGRDLIAIGGSSGNSKLNTVEKYDTICNEWTMVASMKSRRSSVSAALLECFNLELALASND